MADDQQVGVEMEYQRLLAALHEARTRLDEVEAAQRRLVIDKRSMNPEQADKSAAVLGAKADRARIEVTKLHDAAGAARRELRRRYGPSASEPEGISEEPAGPGFEQPPFGGSQ